MVPASRTKNNGLLAGQTWDLNPEDIDYVVAVKATPNKGPARWSVQLAGCSQLDGYEQRGSGTGYNESETWDSKPGVGYLNLIHRALRCSSVEEASQMLIDAPKSGAHSYLLASAEKAVRFEVSGFQCDHQTMAEQAMGWTNHCLSPCTSTGRVFCANSVQSASFEPGATSFECSSSGCGIYQGAVC